MKSQKIKQFSVSILVVLSLFASSISACWCAHHQEKTETEIPSCHGKTHKTEKQNDSANLAAENSLNIPCECFMESAPKVFAKSETIKVEKQAAKIDDLGVFEIKEISHIVAVFQINFPKPFYLSGSFYNPKSPRAPPRS